MNEPKTIKLPEFIQALRGVEEKHSGPFKGKGKSTDFEEGFIKGVQYVRQFVVPCFESHQLDELTALERQIEDEAYEAKMRSNLGLDGDNL